MSEVKTELELLKEQLTARGIAFKNTMGKATLEKLLQKADEVEIEQDENQNLQELQNENLKLVHCIITPNDPIKQQMGQEYFACGNSVLGTVARVIPFGENWLIEKMLLDTIKEKQTQIFVSKRNEKGEQFMESKLIPAYQVTELPLPTKEEIKELAKAQQARSTVD